MVAIPKYVQQLFITDLIVLHIIVPFLPRNKEQMDDIARGTCPTVTPLSTTATAYGSWTLPRSRWQGRILSSSSILYIFVHVVTPHDGLYCVAAAHIRCFFWRCMRAVQSACQRDPQCARCVYAVRCACARATPT